MSDKCPTCGAALPADDAPCMVDGVRHRADCAAVNQRAFTIQRPACTCGAANQPPARPTPQQLAERWKDTLVALANDEAPAPASASRRKLAESLSGTLAAIERDAAQPAAPRTMTVEVHESNRPPLSFDTGDADTTPVAPCEHRHRELISITEWCKDCGAKLT